MTGVVGLIDRAATLLPGSELSAVLGAIPREKVPNARLVEVLQARLRQLSHDQAELFADMVEISHTLALEKLPDNHNEPVEVVARAEEQFEWASHEIAAALTWTPTASDRELALATALCERLPLVYESLHRGDIDRAKALVFVEYLDPANGDVTDEQARRLSERFVALAPGLTTKQLRDRLYRALEAIDPGIRRRRYVRAVQNRSVAVYLNPRTGTATLVGDGLPADEAAAAVTRLDRLTEATKRAGHPGTRHQISADLFLGMLNGDFHGLTEDEIIGLLLGRRRPEDNPHPDTTDTDTHDGSAAPDENGSGDRDAAVAEPADDTGPDATEIDDPVEPSTGAADDRWAGERVATREGIELRAGLGTAAGRDDHPTEIPGLGPVGAQVARDVIATHRRGARWVFALVDCDGYLLLAGSLRRRPRTGTPPRPVRGGTIELHLTLDELHRYTADPAMADWHGVFAEIAHAWDHRHELGKRLAANPEARFARGPLADHVCVRDRYCVGPGCTCSARRSDLDHTLDHAFGGQTVQGNIGPACRRHHPDKNRGWTLSQLEPGLFRWVSPLGQVYFARGEPISPDLPDPDPADHPGEETTAEVDERLRRHDPPILERPATDPPRPPPKSDPPLKDPPPPF